jgi:hypothetical protein
MLFILIISFPVKSKMSWAQSGSSGSVGAAPQSSIRSDDPGWLHGAAIGGNRQHTECKYCHKKLKGGGITRLKEHLAGGFKNVAACPSVPRQVREQMRGLLTGSKSQKQAKQQREERFTRILFDEGREQSTAPQSVDDSEDEEVVYPPDCTSPEERRIYLAAIRQSKEQRWQEEELRRTGHRGASGRWEAGSGSAAAVAFDTGASRQARKERGITGVSHHFSQRFDNPDAAVSAKQKTKQKTIRGMFGNAKEKVGKAVAKYMFFNAIPPNTAKGPYLQNLLNVAASEGKGISAPSPKELMGKYLREEKEELNVYINGLKRQWPMYGVTLMCDGWTSATKKQLVNFLAYCDGRAVFLKSIDASAEKRDHKYLYRLMVDMIEEIGPSNVVQVVTDNGTNFKKAGQKIMDKYSIFWTPCAAHCIDLILKDFGKTRVIEKAVRKARMITNFIYNHSGLLAYMRSTDVCGGDLIRPGVTRFATNYIALQSILDKKAGLKHMFNSEMWYNHRESDSQLGTKITETINDPHFWEDVRKSVTLMKPVTKVLRLVDGDKRPTMGFIYEAMNIMKEAVRDSIRHPQAYLDIIEARWTDMLLHPLHQVGKKACIIFHKCHLYQ